MIVGVISITYQGRFFHAHISCYFIALNRFAHLSPQRTLLLNARRCVDTLPIWNLFISVSLVRCSHKLLFKNKYARARGYTMSFLVTSTFEVTCTGQNGSTPTVDLVGPQIGSACRFTLETARPPRFDKMATVVGELNVNLKLHCASSIKVLLNNSS